MLKSARILHLQPAAYSGVVSPHCPHAPSFGAAGVTMAYNLLPPGHGAAACEGYFDSCGHAVLGLELSGLLRSEASSPAPRCLVGRRQRVLRKRVD